MNGDTYSSRDGGRHGSSREHYPSRPGRDDRRERERDGGRRRSRSPGHRGGRPHDYEVDTYSSSRDIREREREDRYRDRRDDREWDRDRGPRRDHADRPPRRERADRDLFDDRRGAGGGGHGGGRRAEPREEAGGHGPPPKERKRSPSPTPKKREPTPDLTDVVPILDRKRRLTQWDIKPPGYENVTAEQAKLSGMFPLPGAPRQQPMDPSRLKAFMDQPAGSTSNAALKPLNAKQSRRLFVNNLPSNSTTTSVVDFFNLQLNGINLVSGVDPCVSVQLSRDNRFALLEFKEAEDATTALALDGITMGDDGIDALEIRRPKDYIAPPASDDTDQEPGVVANVVNDSPNKISISNIPPFLAEEQIIDLLVSFGELKAFALAKDTGSDQSRGIAFCEFSDPSVTAIAVEGLDGMELGEHNLKVRRASIGLVQASGLEMGVNAMSMLAGTMSTDLEQGRVLQLLNMVTPDELMDPGEYQEIYEDVKEECEKFGEVEAMEIPRPSGGSRQTPGVGKIFVKFQNIDGAKRAMQTLAGRKFADRTVVVTFFGEEYFDVRAF